MKKVLVFCISSVLVTLLTVSALASDVYIGTGGIQGVYYPTGIDICAMVEAVPEYGINCEVISSGGSVININQVLDGIWQFGIAQSDFQYDAWNGSGEWEDTPQENLRAVFSIHYESVTLVAAADAGIETIQDLEEKDVNLGVENSGGYWNALDILTYAEIENINPSTYGGNDAVTRFQNGELDALFITIGHPSDFIMNLVEGERKVYFVELNLEGFTDEYPSYTLSTIPIKYYNKAENNKDIPTVGVKATFVTSTNVPDEVVYAFTKEVFDNFSYFQALHPTRQELTKNNMLKELTAPIHPGALKYYKEVIFVKSASDK
jgi:TRAP transporter TAXI family solute receptor